MRGGSQAGSQPFSLALPSVGGTGGGEASGALALFPSHTPHRNGSSCQRSQNSVAGKAGLEVTLLC